MFAFIPDMAILCLSASLSLGAANLYNRLAGPPFLIQRGKEKPVSKKSVAISDSLPQAIVRLSHFLKLRFHKSNYLHSEITSITVAPHRYFLQ